MATIDIYDKGQVDALLSAKANTTDLPSASELVPDYSEASADDVLTIENGAPVWKAGGSGGEDYDVVISPEKITLSTSLTRGGNSLSTARLMTVTGMAIGIKDHAGRKISAPFIFAAGYSPTLSCTGVAGTSNITNATDISTILSKITVKPGFTGFVYIAAMQYMGGYCAGVYANVLSNKMPIKLSYTNGVLDTTPSSIPVYATQGNTAYAIQQVVIHAVAVD